jgi:hypothetical protein
MGDTNVRVISAAQGGNQGVFETVNIATDAVVAAGPVETVPGDVPGTHQSKSQVLAPTGAAFVGIPGTIPSVIAGATGPAAGLVRNGLRTIVISGYTGPS